MSQSKKEQRRQNKKPQKQIDPIYKDQSNVFLIENPQVIPSITSTSRDILKQLLHTTTLAGFKNKSINWIQYMTTDNSIEQMLIKIKQVNIENQKLPKYSIQVHPIFKKYSIRSFLTRNSFQVSGTIHNLTEESFKSLKTTLNWNYKIKQFDAEGQLKLWAPWSFAFGQKWSKPLTNKYVTDSKQFRLNYFLDKDSNRVGTTNLYEYYRDVLYLQMKGYQTRVKRGQENMPQNYLNQISLKKVDIIQIGYKHDISVFLGTTKKGFKLSIGTDFYNTWYVKLLARYKRLYPIGNKYGLLTYGQCGIIDGKDVLPHQMFSRNQTRWMGERSKVYGNCRFDFIARGFKLLQTFNIVPSNYFSLWLSKSYQNKVKLQAEIGVSLQALHNLLRIDFSLLRLSGVKDQPRFGLKYQF